MSPSYIPVQYFERQARSLRRCGEIWTGFRDDITHLRCTGLFKSANIFSWWMDGEYARANLWLDGASKKDTGFTLKLHSIEVTSVPTITNGCGFRLADSERFHAATDILSLGWWARCGQSTEVVLGFWCGLANILRLTSLSNEVCSHLSILWNIFVPFGVHRALGLVIHAPSYLCWRDIGYPVYKHTLPM